MPACQLVWWLSPSMQQNRLAHQGIIAAQEFIDLFHAGLAGDQFRDIAAKVLRQHAGDKGFTLAALVDDFITAKTQGFKVTVDAEFDDAILLAVIDQVHFASFAQAGEAPAVSELRWGPHAPFQAPHPPLRVIFVTRCKNDQSNEQRVMSVADLAPAPARRRRDWQRARCAIVRYAWRRPG